MTTTDTHVYFYGGPAIYSNWWTTPNQIKDPATDLFFNSTEQAFMWYKANFFGDRAICVRAVEETDASKVKQLGRLVKNYDEAAWQCVRLGFMTYVNLMKYRQNPEFLEQLLSTGNKILVEASPYDKIWGVGLAQNDKLILDSSNWKGQNLLGIALMKVRELLKK